MAALPSAAQRRLKRLTAENETSILADARFFERRPDRNHRIRLASRAEVEMIRLLHPDNVITPGMRWYTSVRQIRKGVRLRGFTIGLADLDCDETEEVCRSVYERGRSTREVEIEQSLRLAMEARS
ncbi:hypothetical protein ASG40_18225 [Methylobacterium sp. Leaf399]|uniref:hypothetical protein n=1 Tax=Methylobacterium sp. Leaf399 TaxID=1736364 RepID=UPI000700F382|nr:hypothetical protein [Methylobacterium sp. Leaf399]KQT16176.1 hypothetical protein ASG40_18225 [Methylobacterium sp. Leaf399]